MLCKEEVWLSIAVYKSTEHRDASWAGLGKQWQRGWSLPKAHLQGLSDFGSDCSCMPERRSLAQSLRVLQRLGFVVWTQFTPENMAYVKPSPNITALWIEIQSKGNLGLRLSISSCCAKIQQNMDTTICQSSWKVFCFFVFMFLLVWVFFPLTIFITSGNALLKPFPDWVANSQTPLERNPWPRRLRWISDDSNSSPTQPKSVCVYWILEELTSGRTGA